MRKIDALVAESDRFAAAVLQVERLQRWMSARSLKRAKAAPELGEWSHYSRSNGAIYSQEIL